MVDQCFDTLFDDGPVMMTIIDEYWRLVRVNRMWLQTLRYDNRDVLGKRCVDFLTEQSRRCAVTDILPLFWRTRSARSVGLEMVRKDGRVINVLMDAELDTDEAGIRHAFAAIRSNYDLTLWEHTSTMLTGMMGWVRVRRAMDTLLAPEGSNVIPDPSVPGEPGGGAPGQDSVLDLQVVVREVSRTLGSLGFALADSARTAEEQGQNLAKLAEAVTAIRGELPWLTVTQPAPEG